MNKSFESNGTWQLVLSFVKISFSHKVKSIFLNESNFIILTEIEFTFRIFLYQELFALVEIFFFYLSEKLFQSALSLKFKSHQLKIFLVH